MSATAALNFFGSAAPASAARFLVRASFPEPADVVVALSSAFHAANTRMEQNNMSLNNDTRKKLPASETQGKHLRADHVTDAVVTALRSEVGNDRHAAKRLATMADVKPRTAENWLAGRHPMSLTNFFRLAQHLPALASAGRRLSGMMNSLDPQTERALLELQKVVAETLEAGR